jgi:hypothetical protein
MTIGFPVHDPSFGDYVAGRVAPNLVHSPKFGFPF